MNLALCMPAKKDIWATFSDISLDQLNAKAALTERIDKKYIINKDIFLLAMEQLSGHFNILNINGNSSFHYSSCYFDDVALTCFAQHRQGKRARFKVRTRHYIDSDTCFVEIKVKGCRGSTIKKRMPYSTNKSTYLDTNALAFIKSVYLEAYGRPFIYTLKPVLTVRYQRTTLVAINGHERMTIDTELQFCSDQKSHNLSPDTIIIETKTIKPRGIASKILRQFHQHPVSRCSKYCIGHILLGNVNRYNRFLKIINMIKSIQGPHQEPN